ncbi:LytTR family transcriptional regulator [Tenacibaculum lutimaris]|uniref:LytTR family transcriptional regulator n=1 Tax=Tenacibaculum lutimaris TaxID=285258 RepID=A0A420E4W7_9FLAO|nr:LytTR family DNA-binding domain-containing protein [Tenacibaculum lutimaris]RKF04933.1 LytTR family transcriptional regulator [Tenacibaculum lutimaris]
MKKKYPLDKNVKDHLWISFALSLWVFLFLYFAEPFDINRFTLTEKMTFLPIYGAIQGLCYCISLGYQSIYVSKQKCWVYINELIFILVMIFVGFWINFLFYKNFIVNNEPHTYEYYDYFKKVYLPALAIILPFLLISRYVLGKFSERIVLEDKITIKGNGKYEVITINPKELIFIQSSDNYIEVNYVENGILQKKLIRKTLSEIEKSLPFLLKTHRSFLINQIHFKQFKTENKKLFIDLGFNSCVPVSRALQTSIKKELLLATNT